MVEILIILKIHSNLKINKELNKVKDIKFQKHKVKPINLIIELLVDVVVENLLQIELMNMKKYV